MYSLFDFALLQCVQTPQVSMIRHVVARTLRKTSSPVKWKRPLNVSSVVVFLSDVCSALAPLVAARTLMGRSDFMMLFTFCVAACHVCIGSALVCCVCCHMQSRGLVWSDITFFHGVVKMVFRTGDGNVWSDINFFHGVVENGHPPWTWSCLARHKLVSRGSGKWSSALDMVISGAT